MELIAAALAKAFAVWFSILILAALNGTLREKALIPIFGSYTGLVSSGLILSSCILAVALATAPWYGRLSSTQYWLIGLFWLALTLVFEFGFGRLLQHKPWQALLEAYTFKGGNIWPIVLAVTLVSPWLAARLRGLV